MTVGINKNSPFSFDNSKLEAAIEHGDDPKIFEALKGNININAPDDNGNYPIMLLIYSAEHIMRPSLNQLVRRFIELGANINVSDSEGYTSLMFAIMSNLNHEIIEELILFGANVNAQNYNKETPLMLALANKNVPLAIIKTLISSGADVNIRNSKGKTPLSFVISTYSDAEGSYFLYERLRVSEIISELLNAGANIEDLTSPERDSLLIQQIDFNPDQKFVSEILRKWTPNRQHQNLLLHLAFEKRRWGTVNNLIKLGELSEMSKIAILIGLYEHGNLKELSDFLIIAHPNPLASDIRGNNILYRINNKDMPNFGGEESVAHALQLIEKLNDDLSNGGVTLDENLALKEKNKKRQLIINYLYTWLRNFGGYFQTGVLPTDLLKMIGNEIINS